MLSISWISLPPDAIRRMATSETVDAPCGRRWERVVALTVVGLVGVSTTVVVLLVL